MKAELISKLKNVTQIGVASAVAYLGTLGVSQQSYAQNQADDLTEHRIDMTLPDRLTQEGKDFYKDPHKEFEFYRNKYKELARDGFIDSEDAETLEFILEKTLDEIKNKVYNQHGGIRESLPATIETGNYTASIQRMKSDLRELQKHLELRDKWVNTDAVKGKFWNYGAGAYIYAGDKDEGAISRQEDSVTKKRIRTGLDASFADNPVYRDKEELLLGERSLKPPYLLRLSEEFPATTKFNYWLGLFGGIAFPGLIAGAGVLRKKMRGKELNGGDLGKAIGFTAATSLPFTLIFDSIHPLVYPSRLAIPLVYEGAQWMLGKRDYSNPSSGSSGAKTFPSRPRTKKIDDEEKGLINLTKEDGLEVPSNSDFVDPWSIDLSDKGGGKE